jgi:hypothetical protein
VTDILGTPSAYQITRNFFLTECPGRGWPTNITQQVPDPLPTGQTVLDVGTVEHVKDFQFTSSQLMQLGITTRTVNEPRRSPTRPSSCGW